MKYIYLFLIFTLILSGCSIKNSNQNANTVSESNAQDKSLCFGINTNDGSTYPLNCTESEIRTKISIWKTDAEYLNETLYYELPDNDEYKILQFVEIAGYRRVGKVLLWEDLNKSEHCSCEDSISSYSQPYTTKMGCKAISQYIPNDKRFQICTN
jgi:hypothetical protein